MTSKEWLECYENKIRESHQTFRPNGFEIIKKELEALRIMLHSCPSAEHLKMIEQSKDYEEYLEKRKGKGNCKKWTIEPIYYKESFEILKEVLK